MKIDDIFSELPKLKPDELKAIKSRVSILLSTCNDSTDDEGIVYGQMFDSLKSKGLKNVPPFHVARKLPQYTKFKKAVPVFIEYINCQCKPKSKIERLKAIHVIIEAIIQQLEQQQIPVALKTTIEGLARVEDIVENQFPGYRESGLLSMIIKSSNM